MLGARNTKHLGTVKFKIGVEMTFLLSHVVMEVTDHTQFKYVHREMELMLTTGYSHHISWLVQIFFNDCCIFTTQTLEKTAVSS